MTQLLRVHTFSAAQPGQRLVVLGGVHGDEPCGTRAIERLARELDDRTLTMSRGSLSLVPVANPLARSLGRREGERNLNRSFRPSATARDYEAQLTNVLCPLLASHDVLLDLHSFQSEGQAFAMIGPRDNNGALEPFQRAVEEGQLAWKLGTSLVVEGWLEIYADSIAQRGQPLTDEALAFGWGTNEYMRSQGGYAVTLECGQHEDPAAPEVAYQAVLAAMRHLGMTADTAPELPAPRLLRLMAVTDRESPADRFSRGWSNFDPVQRGQPIGLRASGTTLVAPDDGYIVFPNARAQAGTECGIL